MLGQPPWWVWGLPDSSTWPSKEALLPSDRRDVPDAHVTPGWCPGTETLSSAAQVAKGLSLSPTLS